VSNGALQRFYPSDLGCFIRSWFADPRAVGAVVPSGRALARLMTRGVSPGARVVELGPGTGTVTRAILDRGVDEQDLVLVENDARFAAMLATRFPRATVLEADATQPHQGLEALSGTIDCVISGLPLVLFSNQDKRKVLRLWSSLLAEDGAVYQFTYRARCSIPKRLLAERGLRAARVGMVALNVPPAFVYRVERA